MSRDILIRFIHGEFMVEIGRNFQEKIKKYFFFFFLWYELLYKI